MAVLTAGLPPAVVIVGLSLLRFDLIPEAAGDVVFMIGAVVVFASPLAFFVAAASLLAFWRESPATPRRTRGAATAALLVAMTGLLAVWVVWTIVSIAFAQHPEAVGLLLSSALSS